MCLTYICFIIHVQDNFSNMAEIATVLPKSVHFLYRLTLLHNKWT